MIVTVITQTTARRNMGHEKVIIKASVFGLQSAERRNKNVFRTVAY